MGFYKDAKRKGLKTVRAHFWRLLRNPVYCGKIYVSGYKDESSQHVPGQHEAIISEAMFYDVQDFLDGRKKIFRTKIEAEEILQLRGYLICPNCGKLLTGARPKVEAGIITIIIALPLVVSGLRLKIQIAFSSAN